MVSFFLEIKSKIKLNNNFKIQGFVKNNGISPVKSLWNSNKLKS